MMVLRPEDPLRSINAAKRAMNADDWSEVERLEGRFTFIGWLSLEQTILDNEGNDTSEKLQAGDHFTTFDSPEDLEAALRSARDAQ
jgi:hypothetical protein